ncbi:MAG: hypothetical protein NZ518_11430 [Dehalococcoidia bacterium]|nr:hypothetical protein [Dehalococcoidia bacterium]
MQPVKHEARVVDDAIKIIQEHLDREARNRRQPLLEPRDLCPMQKARLVSDLTAVLETPTPGSPIVRAIRSVLTSFAVAFRRP